MIEPSHDFYSQNWNKLKFLSHSVANVLMHVKRDAEKSSSEMRLVIKHLHTMELRREPAF